MREWLIAFTIAAIISGVLSILTWINTVMKEVDYPNNHDSDGRV